MANWTTIEDAIQTWVKSALTLDGPHCYWDDQNVSRPASGPFVTLHMGDVLTHGQDELVGAINPDGDAGVDDYKQTVRGTRSFTVLIQAFCPPVSGHTGAPYGAASARALLSKLITTLALPTTIAAFNVAEVSSFDRGQVQSIPALVGVAFEGRAAVTVSFYAREVVDDFSTYIETVSPIVGTY